MWNVVSKKGEHSIKKYLYLLGLVWAFLVLADGEENLGSDCGNLIRVHGNYVFFAELTRWEIFDVQNPRKPVRLAIVPLPSTSGKFCIFGNHAYFYDSKNHQLLIYDVSQPDQPEKVGTIGGINERVKELTGIAGNSALIYGTFTDSTTGFISTGIFLFDISQPASPKVVGKLEERFQYASTFVAGKHFYLALSGETGGGAGVWFYDISNPAEPRKVGGYSLRGAGELFVADDYAYISAGWFDNTTYRGGLYILNIRNPANPVKVGFYELQERAIQIDKVDSYLYLNVMGELHILDVSDPPHPKEVSHNIPLKGLQSFAVKENYVYAIYFDGYHNGFHILDVSHPTSPVEIYPLHQSPLPRHFLLSVKGMRNGNLISQPAGMDCPPHCSEIFPEGSEVNLTVKMDEGWSIDSWIGCDSQSENNCTVKVKENRIVSATFKFTLQPRELNKDGVSLTDPRRRWDDYSITVSGNYAYVARGNLEIYDISNPYASRKIATFLTPGDAEDIVVSEQFAYVADGPKGLRIVDVLQPHQPKGVGYFQTPGWAQNVFVNYPYAYVSTTQAGLRILDVSAPTQPKEVGFFRDIPWINEVVVEGNFAYLAAGAAGVHILDISNPNNPVRAGFLDIPGGANGIFISGSYAYVAGGTEGGFRVIDISSPSSPREISYLYTAGEAYKVFVSANQAFVTDGEGIWVIDISDPNNPIEMGFVGASGKEWDVWASDGRAYVVDEERGVQTIHLSQLIRLEEVGTYPAPGEDMRVFVSRGYAYVADRTRGLRILDVNNPTHPREVASYTPPVGIQKVFVAGEYACVSTTEEIRILNVSNPLKPVEEGWIPGRPLELFIAGNFLYSAGDRRVFIYDIRNPKNPVLTGYYDAPGFVQNVFVTERYLYVATSDAGLLILDISDPLNPVEVGAYTKGGGAISVFVSGSYAYVSTAGGTRILNVRNPAAPTEMAIFSPTGMRFLSEKYALGYTTAPYLYRKLGPFLIDLQNPAFPVQVGRFPEADFPFTDFFLSDETLYAVGPRSGLHIYQMTPALSASQEEKVKASEKAPAEGFSIPPQRFQLTVEITGKGTVTSTPKGIRCGTTCSAPFPVDSTVTLNATPEKGWAFSRWVGCDISQENQCSITLNFNRTVNVDFISLDSWSKIYAPAYIRTIHPTPDGGYIGASGGWAFKFSSQGNLEWQRAFTFTDNSRSFWFNSTMPAKDGGYILGGGAQISEKRGNDLVTVRSDAWVVKLNSKLQVEWQKAYGNTVNSEVKSIMPASDGGFIAVGSIGNPRFLTDSPWIFKLDARGNIIQQRSFENALFVKAFNIQETPDGGYITALSNGTVIKMDSQLKEIWQKKFWIQEQDTYRFHSILLAKDNGFLVVGDTTGWNPSNTDFFLLKLDATGNMVWSKAYDLQWRDRIRSIARTLEGGYIVAGTSEPPSAGLEEEEIFPSNHISSKYFATIWVVRLDEEGNILWQKTYSSPSGNQLYGIHPTGDGGFLLALQSFVITRPDPELSQPAIWLLKLDAQGDIASCDLPGLGQVASGRVRTLQVSPEELNQPPFSPLTLKTTSLKVRDTEAIVQPAGYVKLFTDRCVPDPEFYKIFPLLQTSPELGFY